MLKLLFPRISLTHLESPTTVIVYTSQTKVLSTSLHKITHRYITIKEHQIPFRHLVNPAKIYIISNAHPIIPHDIIFDYLLIEGIKTMSPITFLKARFEDELAHISSFRRQVYINSEDIHNVPGSILINYGNTDFSIFLTDNTLTCYSCKQTGHTSNYCKIESKNINANSHSNNEIIIEKNTTSNNQDGTQGIMQIDLHPNSKN